MGRDKKKFQCYKRQRKGCKVFGQMEKIWKGILGSKEKTRNIFKGQNGHKRLEPQTFLQGKNEDIESIKQLARIKNARVSEG